MVSDILLIAGNWNTMNCQNFFKDMVSVLSEKIFPRIDMQVFFNAGAYCEKQIFIEVITIENLHLL